MDNYMQVVTMESICSQRIVNQNGEHGQCGATVNKQIKHG